MDEELENIFLRALEQNQQKLLRICSVYSKDPKDKKGHGLLGFEATLFFYY